MNSKLDHHLTQEEADEYAIGSLEPEVAGPIAAHVAECSICSPIVHEAESTASALALGAPQHRTPPWLKAKVLAEAGITLESPPRRRRARFVLHRVVQLAPAAGGIAAVTVAIMAFTGMVSLRSQVHDLQHQNMNLQTQVQSTLSEKVQIGAITQRLTDAEKATFEQSQDAQADHQLLLAMLSPQSIVADVYTTSDQQNAIGRLIWSPADKEVFFVAANLQPAPANETYQLWVSEDGHYSSLGTFTPDSTGFARYSAQVPDGMSEYQTAVVTIETAGGAQTRSGPSIFAADLSRFHAGP